MCSGGWSACAAGTATRTRTTSSARCSSSSAGGPGEEDLPDPMTRIHAPKVTLKLVPVFTSGELSRLEKAGQGRSFAQRRDHAIISVFGATGIRLSELAGIRYDADHRLGGDIDLWRRGIAVRGKGRRRRNRKIRHEAGPTPD